MDSSDSLFDNLNVYQLIEIFEYLNLNERLIASKVCRKWKSAIDFLGIQQLTILYFTQFKIDNNQIKNKFNLQQSIDDPHSLNKLNRQTDKRFITYIQTDKLLEQLDNPIFRKLRNLTIFANSSLQLADSYLNLKQLNTLESLQIDNRSLCLSLNMCLGRDRIRLDNLKYLNLHRINLKLILKHFPNLILIKCIQIDCYDNLYFDELDDNEKLNEKSNEKLNELKQFEQQQQQPHDKLTEPNDNQMVNIEKQDNSKISSKTTEQMNSNRLIKWQHFELNSLMEISEYFYQFLIENCFLIEYLKLNVNELDEIILLIKKLTNLKRLKVNCKTNESTLFKDKLVELIRLINDLNSKGQNLKVEFNGIELDVHVLNNRYNHYSNFDLDKFLVLKSDFHTLNYFDLIKIDQLHRESKLRTSDLETLFTCWCRTIHINQSLDNLRILSFDLNFIDVKQLFFKAFDYDEMINHRHLKLLFNKLPNLQSIDLTCVQRLDQRTIDCIADDCQTLKELSLSSNLNKKICLEFLSKLRELERVEFYTCKFDYQTDLNKLIIGLKYFTYLSIINCDNLINVDQLFRTMYKRATINKRLEYNLYLDKPYSIIINQQLNSLEYPQIRNFFFID